MTIIITYTGTSLSMDGEAILIVGCCCWNLGLIRLKCLLVLCSDTDGLDEPKDLL